MLQLIGLFIKACVIGFAISAPIGPIGMLCIRKTLHFGLQGALAVGLGASFAKMIYGIITGAGLTSISETLVHNMAAVKLLGGLLLIGLGIKELTSHLKTSLRFSDVSTQSLAWLKTLCSTCLLTLANPMTIICFLGFVSALAGESFGIHDSIIFSLGIFCGSMAWWCLLGSIITITRNYLPPTWISRIQTASAGMLIAIGLLACAQGAYAFM